MHTYHSDNNFTVESASIDDIPGIIAVLEENLLINKDKSAIGHLEKSGFLVVRHSQEALRNWIEDKKNQIVLVCKEDQEVVGYILGCDLTAHALKMQAKVAEFQLLRDISMTHPVLYHKQIAIQSNRKGVGAKLLQAFFALAATKGYHHIVAFIVHEPVLNKVSVEFHQKHGFEYIGLVQIDDMKAGAYLKKFDT